MTSPHGRVEHPPLAPLRGILARLERAGLAHALGASGLLAALGLVERVNDWDVTVDAPIDDLAAVFEGRSFTRHGNSGCHADHKLGFAAAVIYELRVSPRPAFQTPALHWLYLLLPLPLVAMAIVPI